MYKLIALSIILFLSSAGAADFTVVDLDGHKLSLSAYHDKWVVINFWATWCPTCTDEIPDLNIFHRNHHARDAVVLGINIYDEASDAELKDFVRIHAITYPVARATSALLKIIGPVRGLPTSYLIDPSGKVSARQLGSITAIDIENFMKW